MQTVNERLNYYKTAPKRPEEERKQAPSKYSNPVYQSREYGLGDTLTKNQPLRPPKADAQKPPISHRSSIDQDNIENANPNSTLKSLELQRLKLA